MVLCVICVCVIVAYRGVLISLDCVLSTKKSHVKYRPQRQRNSGGPAETALQRLEKDSGSYRTRYQTRVQVEAKKRQQWGPVGHDYWW